MAALHESAQAPNGASLTTALSLLMTHPTFKSVVARRLSHEEKLRLYALHAQAMYGDAPPLSGAAASAATTSSAISHASSSTGSDTRQGTNSAAAVLSSTSPLNEPLGWLDFAAKERRRRWESLRGRMTPSVAAETFCAELLALMDRYPAREMVPLVEAALTRTRSARAERDASHEERVQHSHKSENRGDRRAGGTPDAHEGSWMFCMRAFQEDPAAMAMLWICRAYGIACELTAEPLAPVPPTIAAISTKKNGHELNHTREEQQATDLFFTAAAAAMRDGAVVPFYAGVRKGQRFIAEVAGPEAGFQLLCDAFLSHLPHWAGRTSAAGGTAAAADTNNCEGNVDRTETPAASVRGRLVAERAEWLEDLVTVTAHLRSPLMVLVLAEAAATTSTLTKMIGEEDEKRERVNTVATYSKTVKAGQDVKRTPHPSSSTSVSYIPEVRTQPQSKAATPRRDAGPAAAEVQPSPELAALAAHVNHFQRTFTQRKVLRSTMAQQCVAARSQGSGVRGAARIATPMSVFPSPPPSLLDVDAAASVIDRYYRQSTRPTSSSSVADGPAVRLVSCVDLYIACCGYVLCTSPFAARLFSRARAATLPEAAWISTKCSALAPAPPSPTAASMVTLAASAALLVAAGGAPTELPAVRLAGMPAEYNDLINQVLRRETQAAARGLDEPVARHLSLSHSGVMTLSHGAGTVGLRETASVASTGSDSSANGHAAVVLNAYAAVDALEQLMLMRILSLNEDDIRTKAAGGLPVLPANFVDSALTPFSPLARILTGAWWLAQRQCIGFPLLTLAPAPARRVDFLWQHDGAQSKNKKEMTRVAPGTGAFQLTPTLKLGSGESYGVDSWESRLRAVGWSVVSSILAATSGEHAQRKKETPRSRVYSTVEPGRAKL